MNTHRFLPTQFLSYWSFSHKFCKQEVGQWFTYSRLISNCTAIKEEQELKISTWYLNKSDFIDHNQKLKALKNQENTQLVLKLFNNLFLRNSLCVSLPRNVSPSPCILINTINFYNYLIFFDIPIFFSWRKAFKTNKGIH